jgi:hypothetical protein
MKFLSLKKKIIFLVIIIFVLCGVYLFSIVSDIVRHGYDKQNKIILFVKSIISPHYVKIIRDNFFIIPNLKAKNEFLELQVLKYEQGNEGKKFDTQYFELNNTSYEANFFFLPFKRLDTKLGWNAEVNSLRAHYAEIKNTLVFSISGEGKTVYFDKDNLLKDSLNYKDLPNNINKILNENNYQLYGIRDLYFQNNQIFISMMVKNENGITINLYNADLNFDKIVFKLFFETKEYWKDYNVFSGGRLDKFKDNKILFSVGFAKNYEAPQNKKSLLGKIIAIDLNTKNYELISYGHRNPQGLYFYEKKNIIINSEHGPKGGDEINFNFLDLKEDKNFGWPRVSYGSAYSGESKLFESDTFKRSHKELGFIEPIKYYDPSIGISEVVYLEKNSFCEFKCLWVSSLRANSIFYLDIDDDFNKLISKDRIFLEGNRIRDIDYDKDLELIILVSENIPALITISKKLD